MAGVAAFLGYNPLPSGEAIAARRIARREPIPIKSPYFCHPVLTHKTPVKE